MSGPACSVASLAADEPLVGTATGPVDRWLLLEVADSWHPKPIQSETFSDAVRSRLSQWLEDPTTRLQLIRRPGRSGKHPVFMVVSSSSATVAKAELGGHEDLLGIDLDALEPAPVERMALVCVHGRRDRCCARHGAAAYRALWHRDLEVWQTSHLGGHRFAACVVTLPDGLMYGRVRAEDAHEFANASEKGEVANLDLLRGRCAYDPPTQAAEIFLRKRITNRSIDAFEWIGTSVDAGRQWTARFRGPSGDQTVRVRLEPTGIMRPPSCDADHEEIMRYVEV